MKLKYFTLAALALATFASCDKLDEVPDNRTEIDSVEKVQLLLATAYPNSTPARICELSGDNYVDDNVVVPATHNAAYELFDEETYKWEDIKNYSIGADDTPYQVWEAYYGGISVCNHAIAAMKEMSEDPANDLQLSAYWGEAHVLRAYLHFVLVNVFAESYKTDAASAADRGIPYVTEPETTVQVDYSTSEFCKNVTETYKLIEKDLLEGIDLIKNEAYKVPAYHFNKNAANAFAARFYLYKRDYSKVIEYANAALGSNPSSMLRKWNAINQNTINSRLNDFNDEKANCNFLIQSTYSLQDRMLSACRFASNNGATITDCDGNTWNVPNVLGVTMTSSGPNWSGQLPCYDGNLFIWGEQKLGVWLFRVYEYFEYTDKIAGIGFVHMLYQPFTAEETLLCRAEAKLYLGDRNGAIQDLEYWTGSKLVKDPLTIANIRKKYSRSSENDWVSDLHPAEMGFEKVLTGDDASVLDCLLHFRRIETLYEGLRWYDIKRYGITVRHHYRDANEDDIHTDSLTWNDPRRVLQLPNNVIEAGFPGSRPGSSAGGGSGSGYQTHTPEPQRPLAGNPTKFENK